MGLRFRKSFKVAPGVNVNVGKKSAGLSVGGKGAHFSVNSSGRTTSTVGIPGTGISYSSSSSGKSSRSKQAESVNWEEEPVLNGDAIRAKAKKERWMVTFSCVCMWIVAATFLIFTLASPVCLIFAILFGHFARKWGKQQKAAQESYALQARLYDKIAPETEQMAEIEQKANAAASMAALVLAYEEAEVIAKVMARKSASVSPEFAFDPKELLQESFGGKFEAFLDREYKSEVRALQKLKTRKTAEEHIERFRRVPEANREKFAEDLNDKLDEYIADLIRIMDMVTPE